MVATQRLEIQARRPGKGNTRASRLGGFVPAIIYGGEAPPMPVRVAKGLLERELSKGRFTVRQFELILDGKNHHVLPRAVQTHPVSGEPMHVDFMRVSDQTQVTVEVQVEFRNEETCPGLKRGGVLSIVRHTIEVTCAVVNMPEKFVADLEGLGIGDSVHVSHINMPKGVTPTIDDRDFTIATIAAPTVMVEAAVAEEAEEAAEAEEGEEAQAKDTDGAKEAEGGRKDRKEGSEQSAPTDKK